MINYLKGILASKSETGLNPSITIEVNNIGYLVETNTRVINSLPDTGQFVIIYTSLIHREDSMSLCGFDSREDRDLFNILLGVSGVGVKVALLLLGEFSAYELVSTVIREDAKALSKAKGVGPKLAQRIILELKDKLTNWRDKIDIIPVRVEKLESEDLKESYLETESVLLSLGYSKGEASESLEKALADAENKKDPEELLRLSLQWLAEH